MEGEVHFCASGLKCVSGACVHRGFYDELRLPRVSSPAEHQLDVHHPEHARVTAVGAFACVPSMQKFYIRRERQEAPGTTPLMGAQ